MTCPPRMFEYTVFVQCKIAAARPHAFPVSTSMYLIMFRSGTLFWGSINTGSLHLVSGFHYHKSQIRTDKMSVAFHQYEANLGTQLLQNSHRQSRGLKRCGLWTSYEFGFFPKEFLLVRGIYSSGPKGSQMSASRTNAIINP